MISANEARARVEKTINIGSELDKIIREASNNQKVRITISREYFTIRKIRKRILYKLKKEGYKTKWQRRYPTVLEISW